MSDAFTLGQHAEAIRALQTDVSEIKDDVKTLLGREDRRSGAWAAIVTVASASSALVAFVVNWIRG